MYSIVFPGVLCGSAVKSIVETATKDILARVAELNWCLHDNIKGCQRC